jgi:hypothetical protein
MATKRRCGAEPKLTTQLVAITTGHSSSTRSLAAPRRRELLRCKGAPLFAAPAPPAGEGRRFDLRKRLN